MRQTRLITAVLLVNDINKDHLPRLERLSGKDMLGVRIRQGGTTTDVYLNLLADGRLKHLNSNLKADGWETDAYLSAITFPDGRDMTDPDSASRYFIAQGSYLRRGGTVVIDSLSKVFLSATTRGNALDVLLQGQPVINASLRVPRPPVAVVLNRARTESRYDEKTKTIRLSLHAEQ